MFLCDLSECLPAIWLIWCEPWVCFIVLPEGLSFLRVPVSSVYAVFPSIDRKAYLGLSLTSCYDGTGQNVLGIL